MLVCYAVSLQKYTLVHINTCIFTKCIRNLACRVAHFLWVMHNKGCNFIIPSTPMLKVLPLDNHIGTKHHLLIVFFCSIHFRTRKCFLSFCQFIKSENEYAVGTWPRAMLPQLNPVHPDFHKCCLTWWKWRKCFLFVLKNTWKNRTGVYANITSTTWVSLLFLSNYNKLRSLIGFSCIISMFGLCLDILTAVNVLWLYQVLSILVMLVRKEGCCVPC